MRKKSVLKRRRSGDSLCGSIFYVYIPGVGVGFSQVVGMYHDYLKAMINNEKSEDYP